jgi:hypothetical protein
VYANGRYALLVFSHTGSTCTVRTGICDHHGARPSHPAELIPWIRFDQVSTRDSVHQFAVLLSPFRNMGERRSARNISPGHYRVASDGADDDLYFSGGSYSDGMLETDARFVLIRRHQDGSGSFSIIDGTYARYGKQLLWSSPKQQSADGEFRP